MEKRVFGVVLTIMGIAGLILASVRFINGGHTKEVIIYALLGIIFFFSGIGLIKNTKNNPS
jgi:intracellular septation protein A